MSQALLFFDRSNACVSQGSDEGYRRRHGTARRAAFCRRPGKVLINALTEQVESPPFERIADNCCGFLNIYPGQTVPGRPQKLVSDNPAALTGN
jgi:hypothetical protein